MPEWSAVPTFGRLDPTLPLRVRPSAYVILKNSEGQIVLVLTQRGCYLPGGGADPGEVIEPAAQREVDEELCLHVAIGKWRRHAIEHIPSIREGARFEKRSTFCDAVVICESPRVPEPDHTALWVTPAEAIVQLTPLSHRWAVAEWLADFTTEPRRP